jgi:hypothetical protein
MADHVNVDDEDDDDDNDLYVDAYFNTDDSDKCDVDADDDSLLLIMMSAMLRLSVMSSRRY